MSLPQGNTAREERVISERMSFQEEPNSFPLGIKTPLEKGSKLNETLFKMNYEIEDQINDNLKNLLMTKKGEKICFNDYGTRLHEIYASDKSMDQIYNDVMSDISIATSKYMPSISLVNYYSKILQNEEEMKKILEDTTKLKRLKRGSHFHNIQKSLTLNNKGSISKKKDDENSNIIYQITVEYKIPMLNQKQDKTYSLTMNILTSK
jgi:phage baseplate assembly protein W